MLAEGLYETAKPGEQVAEEAGMTRREVDTGQQVIDLTAMRRELSGA